MSFLKFISRFFRSSQTLIRESPFSSKRRIEFAHTRLLIRIYYVLIFFLSLNYLDQWPHYLGKTNPSPLWPVFWLNFIPIRPGILFILSFYLSTTFLNVLFPEKRFIRILGFLSLLFFIAFQNSFGKIGHGGHLSLLISFIFIFLPQHFLNCEISNKVIRTKTLLVFTYAQAFIMLTFTMSGIGKVYHGILQIFKGQNHNFEPSALAYHIAQRLLDTNSTSFWGNWLIENIYVGWPLMIGAIYLQLFAIWAAFRPSLHAFWGINLIFFHIASYFSMTILFKENCLWLALFFLCSPFVGKEFSLKKMLRDMPVIGFFFRNKAAS